MGDVLVIPLTHDMKEEVADLYTRVFAGPPWFEVKRCANCEEAYGKDDDLEKYHDGDSCRHCEQPLTLLDYWRGERALEVYEDALRHPGFIGTSARNARGQLIAFSWGYTVPDVDTPSVRFSDIKQQLESVGIVPDNAFYAADTGVDPAYQKQGLGSQVSFTRLQKARETGFDVVCFRTINPKLLKVYQQLFGALRVAYLFQDPDPVKTNRAWYVSPFEYLRSASQTIPPLVPATLVKQNAFEKRFDEYKLIVEDISRSSERRQRTTDTYIALNSIFLSALGVLMYTNGLKSWHDVVSFSVVSIIAVLFNSFWIRSLSLTQKVTQLQIRYAAGIEKLLQEHQSLGNTLLGADEIGFGMFLLLNARVYGESATHTRSRLEINFALTFVAVYVAVTLTAVLLTYLKVQGYIT